MNQTLCNTVLGYYTPIFSHHNTTLYGYQFFLTLSSPFLKITKLCITNLFIFELSQDELSEVGVTKHPEISQGRVK